MNLTNFRAVLFLILGVVMVLTGCAGTSVRSSHTFKKPEQRVAEMKVLYVGNELTGRGNSSSSFSRIGYKELPLRMGERCGLVFAMNKLAYDYATYSVDAFSEKKSVRDVVWSDKVSPDAPILLIQFVGGKVTKYGGNAIYDLDFTASLVDSKLYMVMWTAKFRTNINRAFGASFNDSYVDNMLKKTLEQMAKDGMIALQDNVALVPETSKL